MPKIDTRFLILFAIVSALFLIASWHYYYKTVQDGDTISFVDFRVYYYAGFRLETNENIYDARDEHFVYKYSPIFALIMSVIKFSIPTPAQALCIWYLILFIAFVLCLYLVKEILFCPQLHTTLRFFDIVPLAYIFRYMILINFIHSYLPSHWPLFIKVYDISLLYILTPLYLLSLFIRHKRAAPDDYLFVISIGILFILRALMLNIDRAQVNIVLLLTLLFFTYYLINSKEITAGIYLGIGMIFKIVPVIFLIYMLVKKRFKTFFSSIATFVLFLVIPSFRWGIKRNGELMMNWFDVLRETFSSEYLQYKNQSLMAAISRFFSKGSDIALLRLDDLSLSILIAFLYIAFITLLIYLISKGSLESDRRADMIYDLSLFFIGMTILSPVGTKATFIYMMLPLCLLIKEAIKRNLKDRYLNTGLSIYFALSYLNSSDIIGDLSIMLHKHSLMTFCLLLAFALTVHAKSSRRF